MIKVLIVDDHPLFAEGMKSMFKPGDGIEVVSQTINGHEIPSILDTTEVDLILMDIDMPVIDGIATMELILSKGYDLPILMLTMHQSMKQIKRALEKGAQGYILKDAHKSELIEAITLTSQRKNYFHPKINNQIFDYFRGKRSVKSDMPELSEREKEIIQCLAKGQNSKAIANTLHISEHTVKTHRRNIMHKMNVKTSAELINTCLEKGII
ncbi:response regulator [Reichenbachiella agariperforans]|uniref:Two-component system, NarL family, nitrate/nitrite response regulator NarL n=1 Tax=Reichenbachiella agariperforans TaxID=156994 RepID=A0A1M6N306_REIAG|nr:response regulator transcription factor [Reichenbachiella agariperforans]MBU2915703.1 response regulator transcription factor [Reichenbachiella agariperforans]SHJ90109.1 two-component system, NarL family, nitrate/nitrite response regulator NarL [Reichenbachiella agariperforans]